MKTNAIISVSDKSGLVEFARGLQQHGVTIYATGGTADTLRRAELAVHDISDLTAFPEMMGGRVKTLHPKVFGGILGRPELPEDRQAAAEHGIPFFDFVVVNLYPFVQTVRRADVTQAEAIENIDIGGVALIRAAAKNSQRVAVITRPDQYAHVLADMAARQGGVSEELRSHLAREAFLETAFYDAQIFNYLAARGSGMERFPPRKIIAAERAAILRYGENPHQQAALYRRAIYKQTSLVGAQQLQGKPLSFNNIMDGDAAFNLVREFRSPTVAVIKHANPCGVASSSDVTSAYMRALATDRLSAFGGIVAANRPIDADAARAITGIFTEVVIAPDFSPEAVEIFAGKKNLRLLKTGDFTPHPAVELDVKAISGGILLQDKDLQTDDDTTFEAVTDRAPTAAERQALLFAWKVVKWVKSNAIVLARDQQTLGIGAGQMSRVDASRFAIEKARAASLELQGSVLASDAFFPFPDGVEVAADAGATALIQPGGSIRDHDVIAAANQHGMAMLFTGVRHFRH